MAVDQAYIADIASEFATVDEARITRLVAIAALFVSPAKFGDKADYATALYVCHMLKMDAQKGRGMVTSEKLGDVARTFATPSSGASGKVLTHELKMTAYGTQFLAVCRTVLRGPLIS